MRVIRTRRALNGPNGVIDAYSVGTLVAIEPDGRARVRIGDAVLRLAGADLQERVYGTLTWGPLGAPDPAAPPDPPAEPAPPEPAPTPADAPVRADIAPTPTPTPMRAVAPRDGAWAAADAPEPPPLAPTERGRPGPWVALAVVGVVAAIFGFTWVPSGPPIGPDLDCADIGHQVRVDGADPHRLDADGDGLGCEFEGKQFGWLGVLGLVGAGTGGVMAYSRRDG